MFSHNCLEHEHEQYFEDVLTDRIVCREKLTMMSPQDRWRSSQFLTGICKINMNLKDISSLRSQFLELSLLCISTRVQENTSPSYMYLTLLRVNYLVRILLF